MWVSVRVCGSQYGVLNSLGGLLIDSLGCLSFVVKVKVTVSRCVFKCVPVGLVVVVSGGTWDGDWV